MTAHIHIEAAGINHNNASSLIAMATGLNYQDDSNCRVSDLHVFSCALEIENF